LRTKKGFTLAETMIGLGVSMVVLLGVAQSFNLLSRSKKSIEMGADAVQWTQEFRQAMSSGQCAATLTGKAFPGTAGGSTDIPSIKMSSTVTVNVGSEIRPGVVLNSVKLIRNISGGGVPTTYGTNTPAKIHVGVLRVQLQKPSMTMGGALPQPTYIPVRLTTSNSNQILDCATVTNLTESTCTDMHFVWSAGQCLYRLGQCQYAGSYVSSSYTGGGASGGYKNPFSNGYNCPADYDARLAGSVNTAKSCGKGCVSNLLAPVYECVKCYDAEGNKVAPGATASLNYVPEDINVEDDINESLASIDPALQSAVDRLQSDWTASGAACYPAGTTFSGSSCNTSGGGYTQNYSADMCCSKTVKVCRHGFSASISGEPPETYYVPNYMGCN
jgi:hypothetical protein